MKSRRQAGESGYIALMAILIIGAVALAIGVALLATGADSQRVALNNMQFKQARALAVSCGQEALQLIHDNIGFTGTGNLSLGQGSCTYTVGVANNGILRVVSATGTVGPITRKLQTNVTIGASTITASEWTELSDRYGAITYIQGANATVDTPAATTIAATFPFNVTAGNLIAVAVSWETNVTTTMTCTDTRGNTYTNTAVWNDATLTQGLSICYTIGGSSGADTVTVTLGSTGGAFRRLVINEYSGVATTSPVDGTPAGVGGIVATTGTDAVTSGSITTTLGGDLIFAAVMDTTSSGTVSPGTGYTQRGYANTKDLVVEDKQQLAAGSVAGTFTFGATHRYDAAVIAFKAARQ